MQRQFIPSSQSRSDLSTAMALMAAAMLVVPVMDAIGKYLAPTVPSGQIAWSRFFFQLLYLAPFFFFARLPQSLSELAIHAARGGLIALATTLFFTALKYLPLADAISIFFVEPLILTALSALFLRENVGWRRLSAVLIGFLGALIVIQPSYKVFGWAALLPLGVALSFACYLLLTRKLAQKGDIVGMQFYAALFGLCFMSAALYLGPSTTIAHLHPVWPPIWAWALLAGLGLIATTSHYVIVMAFRRAPASVLAPLQYLEIVSATLLGFVVFGDFPSPATWLGVAIIIASGLFVFYRERRLAELTRE